MLIVKKRNWIEMLTVHWEVCYEILVYKSQISQIKTSIFRWVEFSEKGYKGHDGYLIFLIKFNYIFY